MVAGQSNGPAAGHHISIIRLKHALAEVEARVRAVDFKVDFTVVPDWQRRATRLSIAVCFFGMLGHSIPFPPEHAALATSFRQSCNWAAITSIVVTAPLIGKVAQVAFDRLLGTAVGGFLGFLCYQIGWALFEQAMAGAFISFGAAVTIWATTFLAFKRSLDQLARFMQLTYCIVAFGAKPDKGALQLALLRVGGIFAGGLFSVLLAVLVLPRSASIESLREMKKALKALHDLNREVWALSGVTGPGASVKRAHRKHYRHGYAGVQERMEAAAANAHTSGAANGLKSSTSDSALLASAANGGGKSLSRHSASAQFDMSSDYLDLLVQRDEEMESREALVEKLFTTVYTTLAKVDESLAQVKGEIYVWHFYGRYFFLPGVHWFPVKGRWTVPKKDLEDMATCVRRLARMLWTLLLDFEEGFDAEMESVLQTYYPKQLLSELAEYQSRAIADLLQAFPNSTHIEVDNLLTLGQVTDCLMQISDARARQTVFQVKRTRRTLSNAMPSLPPSGTNRTGGVFVGGSGVAGGSGSIGGGALGAGAGARSARRSVQGEGSLTDGSSKATGSGNIRAGGIGMLSAAGSGSGKATVGIASVVAAAAVARRISQGSQGPAASPEQDMQLEKMPLLAQQPSSTSPAAVPAGMSSPIPVPPSAARRTTSGSSSGAATSALGTAPSGKSASASQLPGGSASTSVGAGGGMFISRLLSGTPGAHVTLHLPPRRFVQEQQHQLLLQQQQQQQQQQQHPDEQEEDDERAQLLSGAPRSESAAAGSGADANWTAVAPASASATAAMVAAPAPALVDRSDSFDIFGGADFSFAPLQQPALADTASAQLQSPTARNGSGQSAAVYSVTENTESAQPGALAQLPTLAPGIFPDLAPAGALEPRASAQVGQGLPQPPRAPLPPAPSPPPPLAGEQSGSVSSVVAGSDTASGGLPPRPPAQRTPSNSGGPPAAAASGAATISAPRSLPTIQSGSDLAALDAALTSTGADAGGTSTSDVGSPFAVMSRFARFSATGQDPSQSVFSGPSTDSNYSQRRSVNESMGAGIGTAAGVGVGGSARAGGTPAAAQSVPPAAGAAPATGFTSSVFVTSAAATATAASIASGGVAAPAAASGTAAAVDPAAALGSGGAAAAAAAAATAGAGFLGQEFTEEMLANLTRGMSGLEASTLVVEPVTFPPTEEGYLSQVRWNTFQFIMDEILEELEEAFYACSLVLRKLPYPIGK